MRRQFRAEIIVGRLFHSKRTSVFRSPALTQPGLPEPLLLDGNHPLGEIQQSQTHRAQRPVEPIGRCIQLPVDDIEHRLVRKPRSGRLRVCCLVYCMWRRGFRGRLFVTPGFTWPLAAMNADRIIDPGANGLLVPFSRSTGDITGIFLDTLDAPCRWLTNHRHSSRCAPYVSGCAGSWGTLQVVILPGPANLSLLLNLYGSER